MGGMQHHIAVGGPILAQVGVAVLGPARAVGEDQDRKPLGLVGLGIVNPDGDIPVAGDVMEGDVGGAH